MNRRDDRVRNENGEATVPNVLKKKCMTPLACQPRVDVPHGVVVVKKRRKKRDINRKALEHRSV